MAAFSSIVLFNARPQRIGRGLRVVTGSAEMSASATFADTSQIEKHFRHCHGIIVDKCYHTSCESTVNVRWIPGASNLSGQIRVVSPTDSATSTLSADACFSRAVINEAGWVLDTGPTESFIMVFTAFGV